MLTFLSNKDPDALLSASKIKSTAREIYQHFKRALGVLSPQLKRRIKEAKSEAFQWNAETALTVLEDSKNAFFIDEVVTGEDEIRALFRAMGRKVSSDGRFSQRLEQKIGTAVNAAIICSSRQATMPRSFVFA